MTKREFVTRIYNKPCESCPISVFCHLCKAITCASVARKYYDTHGGKDGFKWPIKDLRETAWNSD